MIYTVEKIPNKFISPRGYFNSILTVKIECEHCTHMTNTTCDTDSNLCQSCDSQGDVTDCQMMSLMC